jgi:hypothetical protein
MNDLPTTADSHEVNESRLSNEVVHGAAKEQIVRLPLTGTDIVIKTKPDGSVDVTGIPLGQFAGCDTKDDKYE